MIYHDIANPCTSKQVQMPTEKFQGIDDCELIKSIGSGAFGLVVLIKIKNESAALKIFCAPISPEGNAVNCQREQSTLDFIAEYEGETDQRLQIAHYRNDVPGVCCPNLLLEYIAGFDLNSHFLKTYDFEILVAFVHHMMRQIDEHALSGLHAMRVYHNDIKPENILYDPRKQLFYLIDFGLAVPLALDRTNRREFKRLHFFTTLQFMSPWHMKIVNQTRMAQKHEGRYQYKLVDDNDTRSNAENADHYALGLTALRVLGGHCRSSDPLCLMARRIVSLQKKSFEAAKSDIFINWRIRDINEMLEPYWQKLHSIISHYIITNPLTGPNADFIRTVTKYLRFI